MHAFLSDIFEILLNAPDCQRTFLRGLSCHKLAKGIECDTVCLRINNTNWAFKGLNLDLISYLSRWYSKFLQYCQYHMSPNECCLDSKQDQIHLLYVPSMIFCISISRKTNFHPLPSFLLPWSLLFSLSRTNIRLPFHYLFIVYSFTFAQRANLDQAFINF